MEIPDVSWCCGHIAISSRGGVVGSFYAASLGSGVTRSFLFDSSTATTRPIGIGAAKGQFATGINDRGRIAFSTEDANQQGYLLQDGAATPIGALLEPSSRGSSAAIAINARGWIAGWSTASDGQRHAILWNGTIHDLGTPGSWSIANGINSAGVVAGSIQVAGSNSIHAAVFIDGAIRDLGTLGGRLSFASAISDSGRVVGSATIAGSDDGHGFVYDLPAGPMIDVEPRASCGLRAVNTAGDAVGSCAAPGRFDHAVIWHAGVLIDLNETVLDPSWELISASAINDSGQIAGTGTHQGRDRAYILTPH